MANENKALIMVATNFRWNKEARKTAKRLDVQLVQATPFPKAARADAARKEPPAKAHGCEVGE